MYSSNTGNTASISYTGAISKRQNPTLQVSPSGLMSESGIHRKDIRVFRINELPFIFKTENEDDLGYDIFAAVFYMVSRYEEYLPHTKDQHGRFPEAGSLSGKYDFTHVPVVHHWALHLWYRLLEKWPGLTKPHNTTTAIFTYDIDVAYAYKGRSLGRHLLSLSKDIVNMDFANIGAKCKTGFGSFEDPSDTYDQITSHAFRKILFFLLAKKNTTFDHNLSPNGVSIKKLISSINRQGIEIGIHPSYYSSEKKQLIHIEKKTAEDIVNHIITKSRQHFLKFKTPDTFRWLIEAGIQDDYSMQYPEMPGFRAGICLPYRWFDLEKDCITTLTIHPGCIMETTFRDDIHISPSQVREWYLRTWESVKEVGGNFISIWHNDSLNKKSPGCKILDFSYLHTFMIHTIEKDLST